MIGNLNRLPSFQPPAITLLIGPGRWGTTTPSLGVPVVYAEINSVSGVMSKYVAMRDDLIPEASLGTHFFSDIVANDILYMALFPGKNHNFINTSLLESAPQHDR